MPVSNESLDPNKIAAEVVTSVITSAFASGVEKAEDLLRARIVKFKRPFEQYLTRASKKYGYIKTILYKDHPVPLYSFYEPLDFKSSSTSSYYPASFAYLELASSRAVLLGTAGCGKSTLMKHLFLDCVKTGNRIPLFVELRQLNIHEGDLSSLILESLTSLGFKLGQEGLQDALDAGRFFLILDGYDEVNPDLRAALYLDVTRLADKYPLLSIAISSRPESEFAGWHQFLTLEVQPLTKSKAVSLIKKLDYAFDTKEKFLNDLEQSLFESHDTFASNPLLLTIMLMTYTEYADIPTKRHLFYEQVFDTLWQKHDASKAGFKRNLYSGLAKDDFLSVLQAFAIQGYLEGSFTMTNSQAKGLLSQVKAVVSIDFDEQAVIDDLTKSTCILAEDGIYLTYLHRSFQEYFAALYIHNSPQEIKEAFLPLLSLSRANVLLETLLNISRDYVESSLVLPRVEQILADIGYSGDQITDEVYIAFICKFTRSIENEHSIGLHGFEFEELLSLMQLYPAGLADSVNYVSQRALYEKYKSLKDSSGAIQITPKSLRGNASFREDLKRWNAIPFEYLSHLVAIRTAIIQRQEARKDAANFLRARIRAGHPHALQIAP